MINSFEGFLAHLDIPNACRLDKPIYKKLFLDSTDGKRGILNATDKRCLKDDVSRVRWLYTLKPGTINIAPYRDTIREYLEVAVLQVELNSPNRMARIAHFVNRSIPYPLVLLFTMDDEHGTSIAVSLADKRINQSDKEKWVLEDSMNSGWINLASQSGHESEFLSSLKITALPFTDFWRFYQALMDHVIAINCANHNGVFNPVVATSASQRDDRLEKLRELEKLDTQKSEIASKLRKEKQIGRQVELNTKIKKINDGIAGIKGSL